MAAALVTMTAVSVSCAADGDGIVAEPAGSDDAAVEPTAGGVPTSAAGGPTTDGPAAAPEALQFTAPQVGGGTLDLASFAGSTVLFWFWAPG